MLHCIAPKLVQFLADAVPRHVVRPFAPALPACPSEAVLDVERLALEVDLGREGVAEPAGAAAGPDQSEAHAVVAKGGNRGA